MNLYAVYDWKAESVIGQLIIAPTHLVAARTFADSLSQEEFFKRHPEDFGLIILGGLNVFNGQLEPELGSLEDRVVLQGQVVVDRAAADQLASSSHPR